MKYEVRCECGKAHAVTGADAGASLACDCGQTVEVPPLHQLRTLAGQAVPILGTGSRARRHWPVARYAGCVSAASRPAKGMMQVGIAMRTHTRGRPGWSRGGRLPSWMDLRPVRQDYCSDPGWRIWSRNRRRDVSVRSPASLSARHAVPRTRRPYERTSTPLASPGPTSTPHYSIQYPNSRIVVIRIGRMPSYFARESTARRTSGTSASSGRSCGRRRAGGRRPRRRSAPSPAAGTRPCPGPSCRAACTPGRRATPARNMPFASTQPPSTCCDPTLMNTGRGAHSATSSCAVHRQVLRRQRAGVLEVVAGHPVVLARARRRSRPARRSCGGGASRPPAPDEPMNPMANRSS